MKKNVAELLDGIANNDSRAFEELTSMYGGMMYSLVGSFVSEEATREDIEDLEQEAKVLLLNAARTYDSASGLTFGLYAKICVSKALVSALRQLKKYAGVVVIPLDEIEPSELTVSDPASSVIERESAAELRAFIRENLSKYENSVWWMHYSGMSIEEIAESLGSTKKSVSNALARIKRKLRSLLS